jgi:hypothetical protein
VIGRSIIGAAVACVLLLASCAPKLIPISAPLSEVDTARYSTRSAGDAEIAVGEAFLDMVGVDGVPFTSGPPEGRSSNLRWKKAFLTPGYHCVFSLARDYGTPDSRKWSSSDDVTASCFDVRSGHRYRIELPSVPKKRWSLSRTFRFPSIVDTTTGRTVLFYKASSPKGTGEATISWSHVNNPTEPDYPYVTTFGKIRMHIDGEQADPADGGMLSRPLVYKVQPGLHTVTAFLATSNIHSRNHAMVAIDIPDGGHILLVTGTKGIHILDGETGKVLKSPG